MGEATGAAKVVAKAGEGRGTAGVEMVMVRAAEATVRAVEVTVRAVEAIVRAVLATARAVEATARSVVTPEEATAVRMAALLACR